MCDAFFSILVKRENTKTKKRQPRHTRLPFYMSDNGTTDWTDVAQNTPLSISCEMPAFEGSTPSFWLKIVA